MVWRFRNFELDPARAELRGPDGEVHVEKQVFSLLALLAANPDRVIDKAEIIEVVWGGRIVGDAAISTCVKQARRAVDDDGTTQAVIKTVHGRGFRFVAEIEPEAVAAQTKLVEVPETPADRLASDKPSIAVLPFHYMGAGDAGPSIADAIPAELISSLSRQRWLFVIARGSSFQFRDPDIPPEIIGEKLNARYVLTGTVEAIGDMLTISAEAQSTETGIVVWSDRFASTLAAINEVRSEIVAEVIGALELHIPYNEAQSARLLSPDQFNAWSHYHVGLQHVYRFTRADNEVAAKHFAKAIHLDDEFARAHAGLSFTNWQTAFMKYGDDRRGFLAQAFESAERAIAIDPHDPFTNYNMGRYRWLEGDIEGSLQWLDRTLQINPNFAQGLYTKAFAQTLTGNSAPARDALQLARKLSPLDPLFYAMLATQALAMIADEQFEEATGWAEQAANSPGSHYYIDAIAATVMELAGHRKRAEHWRNRVLARRPDFSMQMFFAGFPFTDMESKLRIEGSFKRLGF